MPKRQAHIGDDELEMTFMQPTQLTNKRRSLSNKNSQFDEMVRSMNRSATAAVKRPERSYKSNSARRSTDARSSATKASSAYMKESPCRSHSSRQRGEDRTNAPSSASVVGGAVAVVDSTRCNPLPEWLTSTFKTLVQSHPLRLLLPQVSTRDDVVSECRNSDCGERMASVEEHEENIFAFDPFSPNTKVSEPQARYASSSEPDEAALPVTPGHPTQPVRAAELQSLYRSPGPAIFSPTDICLGPESSLFQWKDTSPSLIYGSDYDGSRRLVGGESPKATRFINSLTIPREEDEWTSYVPDDAESAYFSHIYSTPGPANSIIGTHDSSSSEYSAPLTGVYQVDHADKRLRRGQTVIDGSREECTRVASKLEPDLLALDFKWSKFDRTDIVAPEVPNRDIYRMDPTIQVIPTATGHSTSDIDEDEDEDADADWAVAVHGAGASKVGPDSDFVASKIHGRRP